MFTESGISANRVYKSKSWVAPDQPGKQLKYLKQENGWLKRMLANEMLTPNFVEGGS